VTKPVEIADIHAGGFSGPPAAGYPGGAHDPEESMAKCLLLSAALLLIAAAPPRDLPDPQRTPGAVNPAITQANIDATICSRHWSTRSIRPPEDYTYDLKRHQLRAWHYRDRRTRDYEEDHLISLELGGAPRNPRNLWPEPRKGHCGARAKDRLENVLKRAVCDGDITLRQARHAIATNWIAAYRAYVGPIRCSATR